MPLFSGEPLHRHGDLALLVCHGCVSVEETQGAIKTCRGVSAASSPSLTSPATVQKIRCPSIAGAEKGEFGGWRFCEKLDCSLSCFSAAGLFSGQPVKNISAPRRVGYFLSSSFTSKISGTGDPYPAKSHESNRCSGWRLLQSGHSPPVSVLVGPCQRSRLLPPPCESPRPLSMERIKLPQQL